MVRLPAITSWNPCSPNSDNRRAADGAQGTLREVESRDSSRLVSRG